MAKPNFDLLDISPKGLAVNSIEKWYDDNWVIDKSANKFLFSYTRDLLLGNFCINILFLLSLCKIVLLQTYCSLSLTMLQLSLWITLCTDQNITCKTWKSVEVYHISFSFFLITPPFIYLFLYFISFILFFTSPPFFLLSLYICHNVKLFKHNYPCIFKT